MVRGRGEGRRRPSRAGGGHGCAPPARVPRERPGYGPGTDVNFNAFPLARAPGGLAPGGGQFTGFHQLLEPAQVLADLLLRPLAEEVGDRRPDLAGRRVVLEHHADLGASAAWRRPEVD